MSPNHTFRRALLSLSHPLSIGAIVLLLFNDHVWRRVAPSWITGKVGDFVWLIFAPFLLAAILAWLIPFRVHRRDEWIGRASIIITGLIFGLAKTVPAFHTLTINVLEFLTGWPNILRMDPTDLIALPALSIAWWIWEQSAARSIRLPDRGWVLLPLAVLATMADSGMPFAAIDCLEQSGSQILAVDLFGSYTSRDGGLSWTESTQRMSSDECGPTPREMFNPDNPIERFRLTSDGRQIERSEDGGNTWQAEYVKAELSQAQEVYARRIEGRGFPVLSSPLAAIMDATTGNLIVTAGHQGVVVRTPDGKWHAIEVGPYHPIDFHQPDMVVALLAGELLLALVVFALAAGTIAPGMPSIIVRIVLVLGWLASIGTLIVAEPIANNYREAFLSLGTIVAAVLATPVAVIRLIAAFRINTKAAWITIALSTVTALLFPLPFVVWSQGGIPFYGTAMLYALALVAGTLIAGRLYLRRFLNGPSTLITDQTTTNESGGTA